MREPKTIPPTTTPLTLSAICRAYASALASGVEPDRSVLVDSIAGETGIAAGCVQGWLTGVDSLATYAAEQSDDSGVLSEEDRAIEVSRAVVRPLLEARVQRRLDLAKLQRTKPATCMMCDAVAPSQGRRKRSVMSTLGPITVHRTYCYCAECGEGFFPEETGIKLGSGKYTPRLAESITKLATVLPHKPATDMCASLMGVAVSVHASERLVERRSAFVSSLKTQEAAELRPHDDTGLARQITRPADAVPEAPNVAYFETDGVFVMVREHNEERSTAPPPGSRGGKGRRYEVAGREVKNGIIYTADDCAMETPQRGCLLDKTYISHLGTWQAFATRVWPEMLRMRFDQAETRVVLSDGADWIRKFCEWLPFKVLLILDLFHVKKRVNEVAQALYRDDEVGRRRWRAVQYDRVEGARIDELLVELKAAEPKGASAQALVDELHTYIANNRDRMDYPTYKARGLRVGSGAVESANFHVTGNRLKLQGMRWSEIGAADMAVLRTDLFNGRWRQRTDEMLAA
jgi:hypothetical protein